MKYVFIRGNRSEFPVEKMCVVMGVSRSGYYCWDKRIESMRETENEQLLFVIKVIHGRSRRTYGSPRVHNELRELDIKCGRNRVARLMKEDGVRAKTAKKFKATTDSTHNLSVSENLLGQNFEVGSSNKVWVSDITYIPTEEGWLYLSVILDLYNRAVVGWSMKERMTQDLVKESFEQAVGRRNPGPGLIFHTDRGSQYASGAFQALLSRHGVKGSMSRKGNCYNNAVAESFFKTLKTELIQFNRYWTREEAKQSIFEYIEVFYNRERKHSTLGYRSPMEFESLGLVA